jgi:predicted DsbA family dithiol-disulfide isomerase
LLSAPRGLAANGRVDHPTILILALAVGIEPRRFLAYVETPQINKAVALDQGDGERAGVEGVRTLYLDGKPL